MVPALARTGVHGGRSFHSAHDWSVRQRPLGTACERQSLGHDPVGAGHRKKRADRHAEYDLCPVAVVVMRRRQLRMRAVNSLAV